MRSFGRKLPHTLPFQAHPRVRLRSKKPAPAVATFFELRRTLRAGTESVLFPWRYVVGGCCGPNSDRVYFRIVLVGVCGSGPRFDRKTLPYCRALIMGLRWSLPGFRQCGSLMAMPGCSLMRLVLPSRFAGACGKRRRAAALQRAGFQGLDGGGVLASKLWIRVGTEK